MANVAEAKGQTSLLAVVSLGLSIGSLIVLCLGPLLAIPAIVLGVMALRGMKGKKAGVRGRGLAMAGIGIGCGGLVLSVAGYVLFPWIFGGWSPMRQLREVANRAADLKNMRTIIGTALHYADENEGMMPPHLAAITQRLPGTRVLVSRTGRTPALLTFPASVPWQEMAGEVDGHCDYVYIGADVSVPSLVEPGQVIVLYSKDVYPDHGRLLGYADAHVSWTPKGELAAAFENSNRQRAASSLAAVALDGPRPKAPVRIAGTQQGSTTATRLEKLPEIKTVVDAIEGLKSAGMERRKAAIAFLETAPVEAAHRREVARRLEALLGEPELRLGALGTLKAWGTRENVPGLVQRLAALKANDVTEKEYTIAALGGTGDAEHAAGVLAKQLTTDCRRSAGDALIALGPEAEPAVIFYLENRDSGAAEEACRVLGQIGTARSLAALKDVNPKNVGLKREAEAAAQAIQARMPAATMPTTTEP